MQPLLGKLQRQRCAKTSPSTSFSCMHITLWTSWRGLNL